MSRGGGKQKDILEAQRKSLRLYYDFPYSRVQVIGVDMPDGVAAQWEGGRKLNSDIAWLPPLELFALFQAPI